MQLINLKNDLDAGRTAKLFIVPDRPSHLRFIVRVKRVSGGYAWQHVVINGPGASETIEQTAIFPEWEQLLKGIEGDQTETFRWESTDEPLLDYLPEERKSVE